MVVKKKKVLPLADGIPVHCAHDKIVLRADLKPNPRNPNQHPEIQIALLAKIIQAGGWRAPISVSLRSGLMVRGHGRLLAAEHMGVAEVPVDFQDYDTDADEMADLLADNQIPELAQLNLDMLEMDMAWLKETDFDLELAGFLQDEEGLLGFQPISEEGPNDADEEWKGMPEFVLEDKTAFRSIIVHFKDQEAVDEFTTLVDANVTDKTRYIWYPEIEIEHVKDKRYADLITKKVLVVGCPRSGTTYMQAMLKKCGIKIGHENMGPEGTSTWWFAPPEALIPPGYHPFDEGGSKGSSHGDRIGPEAYDFEKVVHLVRHPLNACAGISVHMTKPTWAYIEAHVGVGMDVPIPLRSVLFWIRWNKLIAERNPDVIVRLEHMAEDWAPLAGLLGMPAEPPADVAAKNKARPKILRYNRKPFTWDEVQNKDVVKEAKELARSYGYDPDVAPERKHALTGKAL